MAGVIKRKNKWVAVFRDASGKEVRKSTGVDIKPKTILPGQNVRTVMNNMETKARIIADEMEAKAKGRTSNEQIIEALGEDVERVYGKKYAYIPVNKYMDDFLSRRNQKAQERESFSVEQMRQLLEILPGEWPDLMRVCLYTGGQRLGDVARLKWDQVNLEGNMMTMTRKKMTKPIITPLKEVLLRRYKESVSENIFPITAMKHAQSQDTTKRISTEFTVLLKKYGFIEAKKEETKGDRRILSKLSFHSLRATAVTVLKSQNVPFELCSLLVGHGSEIVQRVYYRPQNEDVARAMEEFGEALSLG